MTERYLIDNDDDGHWYVMPVEQREAFEEWWANGAVTDQPEGVSMLPGHPANFVFFTDPRNEKGETYS